MKVIVDDNVVKAIDDFYIAAMSRHISLSEETVMAKKETANCLSRVFEGLLFHLPKGEMERRMDKKQLAGFYLRGFPFRIRGSS